MSRTSRLLPNVRERDEQSSSSSPPRDAMPEPRMNRTAMLLEIAAEECMEVAQRLIKASRFGLTEVQPGQSWDNRQRVLIEYSDLVGVLRMLGLDDAQPVLIEEKQAKVEKFLRYSAECGVLINV